MSETKEVKHVEADAPPVNAPLIARAPEPKVDVNAWRQHMYPVWLAGLLLLVIEYTFCTVFVANIKLLWVGVLVASVLWLTVLLLCLCCVVPRQAEDQKWLGRAVVGTVMGVMGLALIGGLVGAGYLQAYRAVRAGTIYTNIKPTKAASALIGDATGITWQPSMSVLLTGAARSDLDQHFGYFDCVAPIITANYPFSSVSYWAALDDASCCGSDSTAPNYASCPGWDGSYFESLVFTEPSPAMTAASALSISNSGGAYSGSNTQMYVRLVESIKKIQDQRLAIVLVCYLLPALVALLWLPAFILFHSCGCCNACGSRKPKSASDSSAAAPPV